MSTQILYGFRKKAYVDSPNLKNEILMSIYSMTALMVRVTLCFAENASYVFYTWLTSIREVFSKSMTMAL